MTINRVNFTFLDQKSNRAFKFNIESFSDTRNFNRCSNYGIVFGITRPSSVVYTIIKRFYPGGKKIVAETVKKLETPPISAVTPTAAIRSNNTNKDINSKSPSLESPTPINNNNNIPVSKITPEMESTVNKIPSGLSPGKRGFFNFFQNNNTMLTTPKTQTQLVPPTENFPILTQGYAVRTINLPERLPRDTQANNNNPVINGRRHYEIHRQTCDIPGCNGIVCLQLCSNATARKAIGNPTQGNPSSLGPDKTLHNVSNTNLTNQPVQQQVVMYQDAHTTSATPEHRSGTTKLNTEINFLNTVLQNEDTKD